MIGWIFLSFFFIICVLLGILSSFWNCNRYLPAALNGKNVGITVVVCQFILIGGCICIILIFRSPLPSSPDYSTSDRDMDNVLKTLTTTFSKANETFSAIDLAPFDQAENTFPTTFHTYSNAIMEEVVKLNQHNLYNEVKNAANLAKTVKSMSSLDCFNKVKLQSQTVETKVIELAAKFGKMADNTQLLQASMTQLLSKKRPEVLASIKAEKIEIEKHLSNIQMFFGNVTASLDANKESIKGLRKTMETAKSSVVETSEREYFWIFLIASLIACVVFCLTLIHVFTNKAGIDKVVLVGLYVSIVSIVVFMIIKAVTQNASIDKCQKIEHRALFEFAVPLYRSSATIDRLCQSNSTLLTSSGDGIFIVKSTSVQDFTTLFDKSVVKFARENRLNLGTVDVAIGDLYQGLNDTLENCVQGQDVTTVETYLDKLKEAQNATSFLALDVNKVFDDLLRRSHSKLMSMFVDVGLKITIRTADNGIRQSDFHCLPISSAFQSKNTVKCSTEEVSIIHQKETDFMLTYKIALLTSVTLLSFIGLLAKERKNVEKKKEEDKEVGDVKVATPATKPAMVPTPVPTPVPITPVVAPKKEVEKEKKEYDKVLTEWAAEITKNSFDEMVAQYQKVVDADNKAKEEGTLPAFIAMIKTKGCGEKLCRHGIPVYDHNRVVLKNFKPDFVSASWVTMPDSKKKYILAEGPLPNTIPRFWAMCYQENVKHIVMLCSVVENKKKKCALYFPDKLNQKETYGDFEVTYVERKDHPLEATYWRMMKVVNTKEEGSKPLLVNHIYATWWPDQDIPEYPNPVLDLHSWLKTIHTDDSPIVVHCSAGVGRTGTFVFIEYAIIQLQKKVNIIEALKEFRLMRNTGVQQLDQFVYAIICLLEYFIKNGMIDREPLREYFAEYKRWRKVQIIQDLKVKHIINDEYD